MSPINPGNASSLTILSADIDTTTFIQAIQQNWSITDDILPPSLLASVPPHCLPAPLIEAVHELSTLTINHKDRAYSLLDTYLQARIREEGRNGNHQSIFPILDVCDVEKACESARRMIRGREIQGPVLVKTLRADDASRKRKHPIRDEMTMEDHQKEDGERARKVQKSDNENGALVGVKVEDETESIATHRFAIEKDNGLDGCLTPSLIPTTPPTKHRVCLPPIRTTHINTPTPISVQAGFTPLFNSLKKEFHQEDTPHVYQATTVRTDWDPRVQAAQWATHEYNTRRIELANVQLQFDDAQKRFREARAKMENARRAVGDWQ
jgi:hypothetical protein